VEQAAQKSAQRVRCPHRHAAVTGRDAINRWLRSGDKTPVNRWGLKSHVVLLEHAENLVELAEYCEQTTLPMQRDRIPDALLIVEACETAIARIRAEFTKYEVKDE
jgi:hypothetical protein